MNKFIKVFAATALLSIAACSDTPVAVNASDICNEEYKDVLVTVEGVIQLPESFYTTRASVTMVFEAPAGKYRIPALHIYTANRSGEKKNMIEPLNEGFTDADVKIYDDKGGMVKLGDKIRVTGEVIGASKEWCEIDVQKIEKIN
ncbi:MAG: hypothetical protein EOO45_22350 [Flavobacterium sp.]|nr:MAG: hypothetical protein EOO45_22350 [Flavobacterium sp.]